MMKRILLPVLLTGIIHIVSYSQEDTLVLHLNEAIDIALDSSLSAFKAEHLYRTAYWSYHNYKAQRLPSLDLVANPVNFNRAIDRVYSSTDSGYVFIQDQSLYSQAGLRVNQKLTATNGEFFIKSDISRLHNIGSPDVQFSATPFSVGYAQPLFGYNAFKWRKRTEPVQYEKAKKELVQSSQEITLELLPLFFNLSKATLDLKIAQEKSAHADTLYSIGQKRFVIAGIDKADLLTLKLEYINAQNELARARHALDRAMDALKAFLKLDEDKIILPELPEILHDIYIDPGRALKIARQHSPFYLGLKIDELNAESAVEQAKRESMLNASLNASLGFNQQANQLSRVYNNLLDQQIVSLSLEIPLVDWGVRKSEYNMAKSERDVVLVEIEQERQRFRQDLLQTVHEFNLQGDMLQSSKEAAQIAKESYEMNVQRFLLGKIDINALTVQQTRQEEAQRTVIEEMEKFWQYFYTIRQLTLYDFENNQALFENFEEYMEMMTD